MIEVDVRAPRSSTRPVAARLRVAAALLLPAAAACDSEAAQASEARPAPALPVLEGDVLRLTPAFAALIGLRTHAVAVVDVAPAVHATGVLEFDERRVTAVGSRIWGRVQAVHVVEGARVRAGDVLATLESAELGEAQAAIAAIAARARYAGSDERRQRQLLAEGIASRRAFELAAQAATVSRAELLAARHRVQALAGRGGAGALGRLALTAPIDGDVVDVDVFRGQAVEPSHTAFTLAERSPLWVRLAVFEGDVGHLRVGDPVEVVTQVDPAEVLGGTLAFISGAIDPVSRSAEVRVIVDNREGKLRAGQAVTARLRPGAAVKRGPGVPRSALVLVDGEPTVFVALDETTVAVRVVEPGVEGRDLVEVKRGLAVGERVVVDGVFALKSELFR